MLLVLVLGLLGLEAPKNRWWMLLLSRPGNPIPQSRTVQRASKCLGGMNLRSPENSGRLTLVNYHRG